MTNIEQMLREIPEKDKLPDKPGGNGTLQDVLKDVENRLRYAIQRARNSAAECNHAADQIEAILETLGKR